MCLILLTPRDTMASSDAEGVIQEKHPVIKQYKISLRMGMGIITIFLLVCLFYMLNNSCDEVKGTFKQNTLMYKLGNSSKPAEASQMKLTTSGQVSTESTWIQALIVKHPHPTTEPGIMFVQTSGELNPSPLIMCSVESAARLNPNKPVYFFMKAFNGDISAYQEPEYKGILLLSSFKNVFILPLNPKELFSSTPLAGWYEKVDPSKETFWFHVLADGCRLALLWKYGGIYLDTDVISIKPLQFENFLCEESNNRANNAALGFNHSHSFIESCLSDFVEDYNGADWGHQGPKLMTRILKKWCGTDDLDDFLNKKCKGILYLSSNWFYPVPYTNWQRFFEEGTWNENSEEIRNEFTKTRGVHIWNFLSGRHRAHIKGSRSIIEYLFSEFCPSTYEELM
ncbi:alpha-1,4-N-acetylglucosaminyltransferase-like [Chiloscyllium plagiosum]|uniref:alpha-1,4-N-acetylglucosaminyltransferase-like n=1 Tax=Chiloscyllium plagiosum TaxID=36176 RepID=UPI001CB7E8AF|nr:alpha-1,4-N-acetylglucosaminyltransferase-like [Chiloscyllium plagiosum]